MYIYTHTHTHIYVYMIMGDGVLQLSITDKTKGLISKLLFHISNDYNEFFLSSLLGYLFTIFRIQMFFFIANNSTLTMPPPFTVTS